MSMVPAVKEEPLERKEIFIRYSPPEIGIAFAIIGVGFLVTATVITPLVRTISPSDKLHFLVMIWGFAVFIVILVVIGRRRGERYKDRPIMVLDSEGFWHRRLRKKIAWSRVRSIKKVDDLGIVVSYIWDWFEIPQPSWYVDRDGVRYSKDTLCQEMRAYWIKYGNLSFQ